MNTLILFGSKYLIILPVLTALYFAWKFRDSKRTRYILITLISLPAAYVAAKIAGHLYYDARPFVTDGITPLFAHAADNGFPSDHTLLASAIAAIVTLFEKRAGIMLWIVAIAIGAARVAAGVHHPIDIAGSILIAALATLVVARFMPKEPSI